jgi:hypothetical protein
MPTLGAQFSFAYYMIIAGRYAQNGVVISHVHVNAAATPAIPTGCFYTLQQNPSLLIRSMISKYSLFNFITLS